MTDILLLLGACFVACGTVVTLHRRFHHKALDMFVAIIVPSLICVGSIANLLQSASNGKVGLYDAMVSLILVTGVGILISITLINSEHRREDAEEKSSCTSS